MKILVADDDRLTRDLVRKNLGEWGHSVVEVSDGAQAWEILKSDPEFRVAVLDWMMPGLEGVEICAKLMKMKGRPGIYTILLTARDRDSDLLYALNQGAHCFLSKPVNLAVLRAHVAVGCRLADSEDKLLRMQRELKGLAEERARRLVESEALARTDPLTGALNLRGYSERATVEFDRAVRNRRPLSLLKIDIDHFKQVNDNHGHDAGDEVLKRVVATLGDGVREIDVVGRIGGEEFEILLPETDIEGAVLVGERLRACTEDLVILPPGSAISVTISLGVAELGSLDRTLVDLQRRGDTALYRAKQRGRNTVMIDERGVSPADPGGRPLCESLCPL